MPIKKTTKTVIAAPVYKTLTQGGLWKQLDEHYKEHVVNGWTNTVDNCFHLHPKAHIPQVWNWIRTWVNHFNMTNEHWFISKLIIENKEGKPILEDQILLHFVRNNSCDAWEHNLTAKEDEVVVWEE